MTVGMPTTRICPRCGNQITGTLDRCPNDGTPLFSEEIVARVGMVIKDHEIQGVIGDGGMGVVYRAQHLVIEKPVAIKVLHDQYARQKDVVEQFLIEAKAASRIRHPNIIDVTDFGTTPEGMVYLVMEYLDGESLADRLQKTNRIPVFEAVNIVRQVASGLGAAHELGIVHRDLKPANIFLCTREGRRRIVRRVEQPTGPSFTVEPERTFDYVKLLDFGVAKFLDLGPGMATRAGVMCGTPHYLSPEQAQDKPASERSDLYALGVVFYEMVAGTVPYGGDSMLQILNGHVNGRLIPPSERAPAAGIDPSVDAVVAKCLEKDPARRFANTDELCDALNTCVTDRAFLRDAHRLPGIESSGIDLSKASARPKPQPAADLTVDLPDARPADGGTTDEELNVFDSDGKSGAPAEGDAGLLEDTMWLRRNRGNRTARLALMVGGGVLGLGLGAWMLLRSDPKTPGPVPTATPVVATAPKPAPVPAPAPATPPAAPPTAAVAPAPEPSKPAAPLPPAPAPTAAAPAAPPAPTVAGKSPERGPGKGPGARTRPSSTMYGVPVPAALMPKNPEPAPAPVAAAPEPPPAPAVDTDALLRKAQQAWLNHYYAVAIDNAHEVLKVKPNSLAAYQIIAACSCSLGDAVEAREAASHLDEKKRKLALTVCERNGVKLDE
jgi:serine/threonine protein kinase